MTLIAIGFALSVVAYWLLTDADGGHASDAVSEARAEARERRAA